MRYILLNEGETLHAGDEGYDAVERAWIPEVTGCGWYVVTATDIIRRKVDAALEPVYESLFRLQGERFQTE